jgi:hypothetical protein
MHLFVIYIEPMVTRIANSLKGIRIFEQNVTVRAMVDDVTIFVSCDEDIIKAGEILDQFCQWTKAMMNKDKTKALALGSWIGRTHWPLQWLASSPTLPLLGINFSPSIVETVERLWNSAFGKFVGNLIENSPRRFTVHQKVNYVKTQALSKTIYLAQVLPCPENISIKILQHISIFIWSGKLEKPQKSVLYRPIPQGGLSLPNIKMFYQALFLKPLYNTLVGPESPERSLLRFWTAFPLRKHLDIYQGNKTPVAVIGRPFYIKEPVHQIQQLITANIVIPNQRMVHRQVYNHWISGISGPGKVEDLYPRLDWNFIWKNTAALPNNIREIMFFFNQRILPTRDRCHRIDKKTNDKCTFCQQVPETDEHLFLDCPSRQDTRSWLERTLRTLGCRTTPMEFIRGHLGPTRNPKTSFALVAAYIYATWKERKNQRTPTQTEVESLWVSIRPKPKPVP